VLAESSDDVLDVDDPSSTTTPTAITNPARTIVLIVVSRT
jgi:hypothetical protein